MKKWIVRANYLWEKQSAPKSDAAKYCRQFFNVTNNIHSTILHSNFICQPLLTRSSNPIHPIHLSTIVTRKFLISIVLFYHFGYINVYSCSIAISSISRQMRTLNIQQASKSHSGCTGFAVKYLSIFRSSFEFVGLCVTTDKMKRSVDLNIKKNGGCPLKCETDRLPQQPS